MFSNIIFKEAIKMIRHIVFFKFKDTATTEDRARLIQELRSLKDDIEVVRDLEVGLDISEAKSAYDLALNSSFDSVEDLADYAVHPAHLKVVELVEELTDERKKVDYEY
jgi:hypothetical protein